ncbi:MAG TPA: hypothetical protein VKU00_15195 [Chthonomonadaceae bacterium]|nr:hypothetical protein [Chthonomonadaceae bacterium]
MADFSLVPSTPAQVDDNIVTVKSGDTVTYAFTVNDLRAKPAPPASPVKLTVKDLPSGAKVYFDPSDTVTPIADGAPIRLIIQTQQQSRFLGIFPTQTQKQPKPGSYVITIQGQAGQAFVNVHLILKIEPSLAVVPSTTVTSSPVVTPLTQFYAFVATLYLILVSLFLLCGLYAIWPAGKNALGNNTGSTQPTRTGEAGDFSLALDKQTLQIGPGDPDEYFVTVQSSPSFTGDVSLNVGPTADANSKLPVPTIDPSTVFLKPNSSVKARLKLNIAQNLKPGSYPLTVTGTYTKKIQPPNTGTDEKSSHSLTATVMVPEPGAAGTDNQVVHPASFTLFGRTIWENQTLPDETRLWIIITAVAALGSTLHGLRSLFWYIGNREFVSSWFLMYLLLPLTGAILGLGFYFIIRGGFFSPTTTAAGTSPYGFAALAFVIGLFSAQANLKLKQIFETMFTTPAPGNNAKPQDPVPAASFAMDVAKPSGPVAKGQTASLKVTLTPMGGFEGTVTLSATSAPTVAATALTFAPLSLPLSNVPAVSTLSFQVPADAASGTAFNIAVTGTSGVVQKSATVAIQVT